MNIAFVVYSHYSRDGRVRKYAEFLAKRKHQIDVFCIKENYVPVEKNIRLHFYPINRRRAGKWWYIFEYKLFFLYAFVVLAIHHLRHNYRLVHVNNMPDFLVFAALIPKLTGAKIILDMHDPMPELYMSKYKMNSSDFIVRSLLKLERLSMAFADAVITANPFFRDVFIKRRSSSEEKIAVINNYPDEKIFKRIKRTNTSKYFTLCYMGSIDERFGLDIAMEGVKLLVKKISNIRFEIYPKIENEGAYFNRLKEAVKKYRLENNIKFNRPLPLEDIAEKLTSVDVGIVLAKENIFTGLIIPVKLLEFMQLGIPVIVSRTTALTKIFKNHEIQFLEYNSSEEFAAAVAGLYRSHKKWLSFSMKATAYMKKHNWWGERMVYDKLIAGLIRNS